MEKQVEAIKTAAEITVEDCIDLYERKGYAAICNDGKLDGFLLENKKASPGNNVKFIWLNSQDRKSVV